jgi:signal peptidase I
LSVFTRIRRNEYFKSAMVILLIVAVVLGIFFGVQFALGTAVPIRVVESGSMSLPLNFISGPPYSWNDFLLTFEHPFDRTLDTGDIIIIQRVNPRDLNTNYPNSDIIVYQNPGDLFATPIVHRIVAVDNINGTLYFQTKGDGNGQKWPSVPPSSMYDSNGSIYNGHGLGVPQNLVEGKVILRIPYFGWITLFLKDNSWGLPLIIALILLLVVLEFVIPMLRRKKDVTTRIRNKEFEQSKFNQCIG